MIYFFIVVLMFPITMLANISVSDMFAKPTMNKYEAEVVAKALQATSPEAERDILLEFKDKKWAGAPLFFNIGNACYKVGAYTDAAKYYELALSKHKFFLAYKNLGYTYSALNMPEKAFEAFACALAISGNSDVQILLWMADYRVREGDVSAALAMCNQALIYDNNNDSVIYAKCRFLLELNLHKQLENLATTRFQQTKDIKYLRLLIKSALVRADNATAISLIQILKSLNATDKTDINILGDLYFTIGAYQKSIETYTDDVDVSKLENLSFACINVGDFKSAKLVLLKLKDDNLKKKISGIIAFREGDLVNAKTMLSEYVKASPTDFVAVLELADVLYKMKDFTKSSAMYSRLLADKGMANSAKHGLLRNALALGNYQQALRWVNNLSQEQKSAELEHLKTKLEAYCNELEKSAQ